MLGYSLFQHVHSCVVWCAFLIVFIGSSFIECRSTVPANYVLPPKPGYIPVYIQHGDTPPDVASMYKSSMPLHHKHSSKHIQKYKNNIYQSGHYMSLDRTKHPLYKPQGKHGQGPMLYHRDAVSKHVERPYYKNKTKALNPPPSRSRRFLEYLSSALNV